MKVPQLPPAASNPHGANLESAEVQMLRGELARTERAIVQLESALSTQGIAMRVRSLMADHAWYTLALIAQRQLIHRAADIQATIDRLLTV